MGIYSNSYYLKFQIRSQEVKEGGEVIQFAFKARKLENKV